MLPEQQALALRKSVKKLKLVTQVAWIMWVVKTGYVHGLEAARHLAKMNPGKLILANWSVEKAEAALKGTTAGGCGSHITFSWEGIILYGCHSLSTNTPLRASLEFGLEGLACHPTLCPLCPMLSLWVLHVDGVEVIPSSNLPGFGEILTQFQFKFWTWGLGSWG